MANELFKVNQICEITNSKTDFNRGDLVRIARIDGDGEYKAEYLDGHDFWYVNDSDLRLIDCDFEPVDYKGCDPIIAALLRVNQKAQCYVTDSMEDTLESMKADDSEEPYWVVAYVNGEEYPYITSTGQCWKWAFPTKKHKPLYVLSHKDLMCKIKELGYTMASSGFTHRDHQTVYFAMLEDCGKLDEESQYRWDDNFLETK